MSLVGLRTTGTPVKSRTACLSFASVIHLPFTLPELGHCPSPADRLADEARAVTFRKSSP